MDKNKYAGLNHNDVVFKPDHVARKICELFPIKGTVLDPCKGEGVFLKYLQSNADWCEITEGRDFFSYSKKVDWIIGNPPYSTFNRFLAHSFELAENVVFLVPFSKIFKSMGTIRSVLNYGGIVQCYALPASQCGFPFGFPAGIFWFKKGYRDRTDFRLISIPAFTQNLFDNDSAPR